MNKKEKILLSLSALFLIIFLLLLFNINNFQLIDNSVNSFFLTHQNPALISISKAIAWIFEPEIVAVYALIISLMLFIKKYRRESIIFAVLMLFGGGLLYAVKEIVQRARPEDMLTIQSSYAFPSGHALISLIFLGFFIYLALKNIKSKPTKIIISVFLILMMIFVGASRLILNVHYFTDVIGGWFLGLFILLISLAITKKY